MPELKQQPLFPSNFNPNANCLHRNPETGELFGDCTDCSFTIHHQKCAPCNGCPRREGYWTPSDIEKNKLIEIKCHEPCRLFKNWERMFLEKDSKQFE